MKATLMQEINQRFDDGNEVMKEFVGPAMATATRQIFGGKCCR